MLNREDLRWKVLMNIPAVEGKWGDIVLIITPYPTVFNKNAVYARVYTPGQSTKVLHSWTGLRGYSAEDAIKWGLKVLEKEVRRRAELRESCRILQDAVGLEGS